MTVRRVSRRARRHLRKSRRGQKGGAYSDANEWAAAVKDLYDKTSREYRDPNNEFIIDKLAELAQISDDVHISIENQSFLLKEVAARVIVFMYNFKQQAEHTYSTYMNWYTTLDSDDLTKHYKKQLLQIENAIRALVNQKPITDIGIIEDFPLYVWALLYTGKSEEALPPALVSEEVVHEEIEKTRRSSSQKASLTDSTEIKPAVPAVQAE